MKKLLIVCCVLTLSAAEAQQPIRLIIRGDDMGYAHSGNQAIIKTYKEGIEKSIEVIVPSPWFPEAVKLLQENPNVDVGIHLAITSEWDNEKWRPLSDCPSLKDENGYFFPMLFPNKNYPGRSVKENKWTLADIEKEFRSQIELGLKRIPRVSHISSHMGCTDLNDSVTALTKRLAKEYHIDIDLKEKAVIPASYDGPHATSTEKIQSFINMLNKLEPGKTYLFVDHPGLLSPELEAIHHIGYENVAADRQGVVDTWTNEKVKEAIKKKGIRLISYKDLSEL
ncbi:MAG: polysaccharide deacetylase family protein [Bacteroidetes bacterium]|nr:polysaccharide deacetylase family protein [Bacteroidota bacterium]